MKLTTFSNFLLIILLLFCTFATAQNLIISSSGETGTSGTNWSTSGTNPVTITATGEANIHPDVIAGYLNGGNSVIVQILTSTGASLDQQAVINKTSGSDATLTMRANRRVLANSAISSTSGKLNVVIWSDYNNTNDGGSSITGAITTNGGHVWAGGSSSNEGSATWNGLTVGNGASVGASGANAYSFDLSGDVTTGGGDILIWTGSGMDSLATLNGIGIMNNPHLNAGSGDISLIVAVLQNWNSANSTLQISSTGTFSLASDSGAPWGSPFTWATTTSGNNITTTVLGQPLQINNFASLSGFQLGSYQGMASAFTYINQANITLSSALNVNGPIDIRGGIVTIDANLTSSANGDIFIKGTATNNPSIAVNSGRIINKSAGTGTLTLQGHARVTNSGTISATGTAELNVVMWSDFDNSNNDGGVSQMGTISTNGGHVWLGGSNTNGGSYTWNGLAVGNGPSIGSPGYNGNALDIYGNITTSGGDFLAWAGNGVSGGINGIATVTGYSVNVGSGDIVLITDAILGTGLSLFFNQSGGSFTLVPNEGDFGTTFNWDGVTNTVSGFGTGWNFGGNFNYLWLENPASLTSLTIGKYDGMLSGSTPVVLSNSSDVTFSNTTATSIAGPISIYGGNITVSQNLTSSLADADILLQATGAIILSASRTLQTSGGDITLNATSGGTATTAQSAIYLNGSSQILSNGGHITLGGGYSGTEGNLYAATTISGIGYAVRMDAATVLNAAGATSGGNINVYGRKVLSYGDGVYLNSVNISTIGNGTIGINGDSFGGFNDTTYFGGITFENQASTIQTVNGNLTLKGNLTDSQSSQGYGINFYRSSGSTGQTRHIQLLSRTGAIEVTGDGGSTIGGGIGHSSWGNVYFGSPADASYTATGDVTVSYSKLVGASANGFKVKTTGNVSYLPTGTSFADAQTMPYNSNYLLADSASSLTIGKPTNTANITMAAVTSVAGPITVYGGSIAVAAAISAAGDILLDGDTGNFLTQNTKGVTIDAAVTTSNNGNITILGKGGSGTSYSANHGIDIKNKVEAGGTGNINIVGYGGLSSNGTSSSCHGVNLEVANAWVKSNGGNVTINGFGGGASAGSFSIGVPMQNSSKVSAAGAGTITITGTGGVNTVEGLRGVAIVSSSSVYSAGGAITITGINGTNGTNYSDGVWFDNAIIGSNASGSITISGQAGTGISNAILMSTTNTIGGASHANNIVLRGNNLSLAGTNSVLTTGQVTIEPYSNSFTSALTFPIANLSLANTITGLTLGKATNTQNITFNSATTIAGPITVFGGEININDNLNTTAGGVNGDVLLKASANVVLANSKSITTNSGDVILWSNSDGQTTNGGAFLKQGSGVLTGGGHIWIGGGNATTTWNGLTVGNGYAVSGRSVSDMRLVDWEAGVAFDQVNISSEGGHVFIAGQRNQTSTLGAGFINYSGTGTLIDAGAGTVTIKGDNTTTGFSFGIMTGLHPNEYSGTFVVKSSNSNQANAITFEGTTNAGTGDGFLIENKTRLLSTAVTNGGGLSISGTSFNNRNAISVGIGANSGTLDLLSASGTIDVNVGIFPLLIANAGIFRLGSIASDSDVPNSTANIIITSNNLNWTGNVPVRSTGTLTVTPTANNSFASLLNTNSLNFTGITGLTLGNATNTSNITFGNAITIAGPITAYGGTIAVNAALTATNSTINLTASTAATQTAAITANGLALKGAGTFTLENTANNIATIAGGSSAAKIGSLSFVDASGGLEIGTVNPTGITSTGPIKIETLEGNITLSENLATDDTTADAIILNAGKTAAIGTATGGDIIVSGTPILTYGTGGRAKLFSGRNSNSTGLTALVGGVPNTRVNVDETTAAFSPVLAVDTSYALYRAEDIQAPIISNFNNVNKMYFDGSYSIEAPTSNSLGAFSYTSSNSAVATIGGTTVTILSAGTSTITANQAADGNYTSASITATLTVSSVSVLTNTGAISSTNLNYVNKYGQIGGNFGLSANGSVLAAKTLPPIVSAGLMLHLDAGNPTSYSGTGLTWTDISGNGNHGTLVNGVGYTSANSGALVFDGVNDYVSTNLFLNTITNVTLQGWVYISNTSLKGPFIRVGSGENGYAIGVGASDFDTPGNQIIGLFPFVRFIPTGSNYGTGWKFFTLTLSETSVPTFYLNGTLIGSFSGSNPKTPDSGVYIASNIGDRPEVRIFDGNIAQVSIYTRALTALEIQQNYNAVKSRFGL